MGSATATARRRTAPPRRRAPARGRTGIRWDRVGRLALLVTLGVILALYVSPVHNWITKRQAASDAQGEKRDLEERNAELRSKIRYLSKPEAVEREARKLGMVKKGERAFVIQNSPRR